MRVILQTLSQIQCIYYRLRSVNCGPGHIQRIYSSAYLDFNIHLNVSALLLEISRQFNARYTANIETNTVHILPFTLCELWSRPSTYSSAYSDFTIHLNVSALLLYISRQYNARYSANLVPNTAHIVQFTLFEMWCRAYIMHLQLRIFRHQYSSERICAAIGDISTIQCALYCKLGIRYSAHRPVYARELWFRTYTMHLQLRIFRLQYSSERICAAIVRITTIQCVLYCKLGARYSAHRPVYAV
jgi:hypothetical protein